MSPSRKRQRTWFSERIEGRPYTITATLSRATGRVLSLACGCRDWRNFTEALAHYAGGGRYQVPRWKENRITHTLDSMETNARYRDYSMLALARLADQVCAYQRRAKKRRAKR